MILENLLGGPTQTFVEKYLHKLPFSMPSRAQPWISLGAWSVMESTLASPDADLMVAREGKRMEGAPPATWAEARSLFAEGYTLLVRHAEKHEPRLTELAREFREDFRAPVNIHIYATPAGRHGFGWHYDAEDVFILQTLGRKDYLLRKNTVNPWPLSETLPTDMAFPRETMPVMKTSLAAGDWLYIPAGWWHLAQAVEDALSLAVGILSLTAIDFYDHLRRYLLDSIVWRQRLPILGRANPATEDDLEKTYRSTFADLARDIARMMQDDNMLRSFLKEKRRPADPA